MKRGKKIEMLNIGEGAQSLKIELRFDRNKGDLFAELGGTEFSALTLGELKKMLEDKAKSMVSYEFAWYIDVTFDVSRCGNGSYLERVDFDEILKDEHVDGLRFYFKVFERSQHIKSDHKDYYGNDTWLYVERPVEEVNGELRPVGEPKPCKHATRNRTEWLAYTPERYAKLVAIRVALKELARRLDIICGGDAKKIMLALDQLPAQPLQLAAQSVVETGRKRK